MTLSVVPRVRDTTGDDQVSAVARVVVDKVAGATIPIRETAMSYSPPPGEWPPPPEPPPHQPPTSPPEWPPPAGQPGYGQPFEPSPAGAAPQSSLASTGGDTAPTGASQSTPPPPRRNGRRLWIIAGITALVILAGASAFAAVFFARIGGESAHDGQEPSPSPSVSDSTSPTDEPANNGQGLPADQAAQGDCLDKPDDVTDTRTVDCDGSDAAAEVVARTDDPDADNTQEAAAAECEDTDSDYTIYLLDDDAGSQRFVLCVKEL